MNHSLNTLGKQRGHEDQLGHSRNFLIFHVLSTRTIYKLNTREVLTLICLDKHRRKQSTQVKSDNQCQIGETQRDFTRLGKPRQNGDEIMMAATAARALQRPCSQPTITYNKHKIFLFTRNIVMRSNRKLVLPLQGRIVLEVVQFGCRDNREHYTT